jgi:bifunctional non-homologous end joining protein LigD
MATAKRKRVHPAAVLAPMPATLDPMLPTLVRQPFSDPEYLFEPKLDGYRAICFVENRRVRFLSRKGHSLTERFPELRRISASVKAESVIIDGEVVALDQEGMPCFEGLHGRSSKVACVTVFYAFDLLYLDGYDLTQCPLIARNTALRKILPKNDTGRVRYTEHVLGSGERLFGEIERMRLEGMVAKRKDSVYCCGRSRLWQKIKTADGRTEMQRRMETWQKPTS